jgi:parallel beta-helix repeat protein
MRYDHEMRKKQKLVRFVSFVFMGLIGILALGLCFSVQADEVPPCPSTIDLQGATVPLGGDCTGSMTVTGPGTLDLSGHTVSGPATGSGTGITVEGEKAVILNGTVTGWNTAVYVGGDGNHKIINLKVTNNTVGIRVGSEKNVVSNNFVKDNSSRGIRLEKGDFNTVIKNYVENSNKGIRIESKNNNIVSTIIVGNIAENCNIKGDNNFLVLNIAKNGAEECFFIDAGTGNRLVNNTAFKCKGGGFVVSGGGSDNFIAYNVALGNTPFDLQDAPGDCEANTWLMNVAYSADPRCIKAKIWGILHSICH